MSKKQEAAITRFPSPIKRNKKYTAREAKIKGISECFKKIMEILELDLDDTSLKETPQRVAEMYVDEVFSGLQIENFPKITLVDDPFCQDSSRLVLVKNINLISFCEHHFVPMRGKAHVAYIPNGKVIGLSKINRVVRYFSSRPQLQERLTAQIADSLSLLLNTKHVAVTIDAAHFCVAARGVTDTTSSTLTYVLTGDFQDNPTLRAEFFSVTK